MSENTIPEDFKAVCSKTNSNQVTQKQLIGLLERTIKQASAKDTSDNISLDHFKAISKITCLMTV